MFCRIKRKIKILVLLHNFIRRNAKYWRQLGILKKTSDIILVEISENHLFEIDQNINIAKVIQKEKKMNIAILLNGHIHKFNIQSWIANLLIIKSYKPNMFKFLFPAVLREIILHPFLIVKAEKIFNSINNTKELETLVYNEILIGDIIYDEYIRTQKGIYAITKDDCLKKLIRKSILMINSYEKLFNSNKVKYLVVYDICYVNHGVLYRFALNRGIKVITYRTSSRLITLDNYRHHPYHPQKSLSELKNSIDDTYENEISDYMEKRFSSQLPGLDIAPAFANKIKYTRDKLSQVLKLDNNKKNAIIMCHAFSDFPHIDKGLYPDYYSWLKELLTLIKNNDKVNWLIKPHPTSYFYNEEGEVEKMIVESGISNVKLLPKNMSTAAIKEIADILLSVRGTAGLEFGIYGIPILNAGSSSYSGYNVCYEPDTIATYRTYLENIDKIVGPNTDIVENMKVLLYTILVKSKHQFDYLYRNFENVMENHYNLLNDILYHQNQTCKFEDNEFFKEISTVISIEEK
jgi:hypothetical protein